MSFFTSKREARLWIWTLVVILGIIATLGLGQTLAGYVNDNSFIGVWLFLLGCFLVMLVAITSGLNFRIRGVEIIVLLGIAAVYLLIFVRMAIPTERSHLIEYGVLGLFIFEALKERKAQGRAVPYTAVLAIGAATFIGMVDETIQLWIPGRVFDVQDMVFNFLAATMAVLSSVSLSWARQKIIATRSSRS